MITSGLEKINHFADCVSSILISESACSFFFNFGFGNSWFGKKKGERKASARAKGFFTQDTPSQQATGDISFIKMKLL